MRTSVSSEIAVSSPEPQLTCSTLPSRAMMLSLPDPPSKTSKPPPPNRPSSPAPPLNTTVIVSAGLIAATSSPAPRIRSTDDTPDLSQTTLWLPSASSQPSPGPMLTPPKRVKRTLSAVSNAAILSSPASPS